MIVSHIEVVRLSVSSCRDDGRSSEVMITTIVRRLSGGSKLKTGVRPAFGTMKLLLVGSTGDIGRRVAELALRQFPNGSVTLLVRSKEKLTSLLSTELLERAQVCHERRAYVAKLGTRSSSFSEDWCEMSHSTPARPTSPSLPLYCHR